MRRDREKVFPAVAEIVTRLKGGGSFEAMAVHLGYRLTKETVRALATGKVGWETSPRTFAEGYWEQLCELYGDEIRAEFGECNRRAVSDWFAGKAGFRRRHYPEPGRAELTYEREDEGVPGEWWSNARRLSPKQQRLMRRLIEEFLAEGERED